jgi:hypothetical protein
LLAFGLSSDVIQQDYRVRIAIIFTNNTNGILENCGCPGNPLGGVDRRSTLIKQLRQKVRGDKLLVDSGDLLSSIGFAEKDRYVLRAYKLMDYDAVGIGDQEFSNGVKFFEQEVLSLGLPLVSASLSKTATSEHYAPSFIVKTVNNVKVAITSVISSDPFEVMAKEKSEGVEVEEFKNALTNVITELKSKADIIVLLSHLGYVKDVGVAEAFPEISVIVGSHSQTLLVEPELHGNTVIVQAGKNGEHVGLLELEIDRYSKKVLSLKGNVAPLLKDISGDPKLKAVLTDYQRFVESGFQDTCMYMSPIPNDFVVVENVVCQHCHLEQTYKWHLTKHARAYQTIMHDGRTSDPECLSCHTTGYCRPDGFLRKPFTKHFAGVGCVECHQVKESHFELFSKETVEPVSAIVCERCHNAERDPDFNFEKYVEQVNHKESEFQEYKIRKADRLIAIATRFYANPDAWQWIAAWNKENIQDPDLIYTDRTLKLLMPARRQNEKK